MRAPKKKVNIKTRQIVENKDYTRITYTKGEKNKKVKNVICVKENRSVKIGVSTKVC